MNKNNRNVLIILIFFVIVFILARMASVLNIFSNQLEFSTIGSDNINLPNNYSLMKFVFSNNVTQYYLLTDNADERYTLLTISTNSSNNKEDYSLLEYKDVKYLVTRDPDHYVDGGYIYHIIRLSEEPTQIGRKISDSPEMTDPMFISYYFPSCNEPNFDDYFGTLEFQPTSFSLKCGDFGTSLFLSLGYNKYKVNLESEYVEKL